MRLMAGAATLRAQHSGLGHRRTEKVRKEKRSYMIAMLDRTSLHRDRRKRLSCPNPALYRAHPTLNWHIVPKTPTFGPPGRKERFLTKAGRPTLHWRESCVLC